MQALGIVGNIVIELTKYHESTVLYTIFIRLRRGNSEHAFTVMDKIINSI